MTELMEEMRFWTSIISIVNPWPVYYRCMACMQMYRTPEDFAALKLPEAIGEFWYCCTECFHFMKTLNELLSFKMPMSPAAA